MCIRDSAGRENFPSPYLDLVGRIRPVGMILLHVGSSRPLLLEEGELGGALLVGLRRLTAAFPLTNFSRDLAPPGQHLTYLVGSPPSYRQPTDPERELRESEADLADQFPEFARSGRILDFRIVEQHLPEPGTHLPRTTPVEGLFNVGDAVQEPGSAGASAAAESAIEVARLVGRNLGRRR